jgi:hypothetical protein
MEATNIWRLMDLPENKNDWRAQSALEDRLMRIHISRALAARSSSGLTPRLSST